MPIKYEKDYGRKMLIIDVVKSYIRNNPSEYVLFTAQNASRRSQLFDKEFGQLKRVDSRGNVRADEDNIRLACSLPSKLYNALDTLLCEASGVNRFGEDDGEMGWFLKEFPEFRIANKY